MHTDHYAPVAEGRGVSLADVLRLALPAGTRVLVGEAALDRPVTWARILRARPVSLASFERGELVLVASAALQQPGALAALPRFIAELAEWGVAGLVFPEPVPSEAVEGAQAASVPLLALPAGAQVTDAERAISSLILDRAGQIERRVQELHQRLLALALEDGGLTPLLGLLGAFTGKSALILDEYLQVQAFAAPSGEDPAALLPLLRARLGSLRPGLPLPPPLAGAPQRLGGERAALFRPLLIRGTVAGLACLVGPRRAFDDLDGPALDRAATVLAIELARQRAVAEVTLRHQGSLLDDLIAGHFSSEEEMLARARALGYDLEQPRVTLVLALDDPSASVPGRLAELAHAELVNREPTALLRERDGLLAVLLPLEQADDPAAATAAADELRRRLASALGFEATLSAGVGRRHGGATGYARAHREALRALEIARGLLGGNRTAHFQELGALRLIFELAGSAEPREFVRDHLGALEEHDARARSDLVQTLEVFLAHNGNHVRAAQELHLHRNTLLYRLEKIRQVLDVDLDSAEVRLTLGLALKIRRVLGSGRAPGAATEAPLRAVPGAGPGRPAAVGTGR